MLGWLATPTAMTPLQGILGAAAAKKLKEAHGVTTVGGLLTRLPQRYAAQGHSLNVDYGQVGESITAVVEVVGVVKPEPTAVALAGESGSRGVMVHEFSPAPGLRDDGVRSRIAAG